MLKSILGMIALGMALSGQNALALPIPHGMAPMLPMSFSPQYNFEGIVALSNCSGSLIAFEKTQMNDHAMVLTNGHCLESGMPKPRTYVSNQPSRRQFAVLSPTSQNMGMVNATRVLYSTMTGTDITLYELAETYADIQARYKTRPFILASQHPALNMPVQVVSGYWKRGYSCHLEAFVVHLQEGSWTMDDSIRYSRPGCEIIGGTSGSPVILAGSRTIVAINNTINEDGGKCTEDNPCEVDANGKITYQRGYGYSQETYQIYSCLDASNKLNLTLPGCRLFH